MVRKTVYRVVSVLMVLTMFGIFLQVGEATPYKVLVVMSYEETYPWCQEIKEGIDSVLAETCEVKYFYMNTKKDLEGGPQKAQEAFVLYQEFQPDGVIAADDNAQSMFVVPYLKDKVSTPIMFCGVNAEPEKYGYPATNISGILERFHVLASLAFAQQLIPSVKAVGFIVKESATGSALVAQIQKESNTYPVDSVMFKMPKTLEEVKVMTEDLKNQCDVLFMETMEGIPNEHGTPLAEKRIMQMIIEIFGKPTIVTSPFRLTYGALCAVIQKGQEQGATAAQMLLQAMQGTPVSKIPITQNKKGKRMLNVDVMRAFGIRPKPHILQGVELVKTVE